MRFESRLTINKIFSNAGSRKESGLIASFEISKLIAKNGKPHTIGENLILPALKVLIRNCTNLDSENILDSIPLSNSSVSRRIDEMADYIEEELISHLRNVKFALQLDETTILDNSAILIAYVRYLHENTLKEEMLFVRNLKTDSKGVSIFLEVENYFDEHNLPLENILSCATDGAASMTGRYKGFLAYLKKLCQIFLVFIV
ncbi:Protein ZBED8 [Dictyocoela muelleri]|nr:Protein ZBED8 [Dictyocoela muelleri]